MSLKGIRSHLCVRVLVGMGGSQRAQSVTKASIESIIQSLCKLLYQSITLVLDVINTTLIFINWKVLVNICLILAG